jgi:hypothetical protein
MDHIAAVDVSTSSLHAGALTPLFWMSEDRDRTLWSFMNQAAVRGTVVYSFCPTVFINLN